MNSLAQESVGAGMTVAGAGERDSHQNHEFEKRL